MSEILYKSIRCWLSHPGNKQIDITNATGVSKQLISMVLERKGKKDLAFSNVLSVIRYIETDYLDVMDKHCRSLHKPLGILNSLEYASNFERHELLDDLIAEYKEHRGEVKEWVEIYRFNRDKHGLDNDEALEKCRELYGRVTQPDAKLKLDLIESSINFKGNQFNIKEFVHRAEKKLKLLRNGFLKDSLEIRYNLNRAFISLYEEMNIEEANKFAKKVTASWLAPAYLIGCAYHLMSHANMYDSFNDSLELLERAANFYGQSDRNKGQSLEQDKVFLFNVHKEPYDGVISDREEKAHQFIVQGKYKEAGEVLSSISDKSPFGMLYEGMCKKDINPIIKGYGLIKESGNHFFARYFEKQISLLYQAKGV